MVKAVLLDLESGSITVEIATNIIFNIGMALNDSSIVEIAMNLTQVG